MQGLAQQIGVGLMLLTTCGTAAAQLPLAGPARPAQFTGRAASDRAVRPAQLTPPANVPILPDAARELDPLGPAGDAAQRGAPPADAYQPLPGPMDGGPGWTYSPDNPLAFDSGEMPGQGAMVWEDGSMMVDESGTLGGEPFWGGTSFEQMDMNMGAPARLFSTREWIRDGRWYSTWEFTLLTRAGSHNTPIATDTTGPQEAAISPLNGQLVGVTPQIGTDTVRFNYQPGMHLRLGRFLGRDTMNRDHAIELDFLGLFDYEAEASLALANPEFLNQTAGIVTLLGAGHGAAPGFIDGVSATVRNQSTLNSGEANWQLMARPRIDRMVLQPDGEWVQHTSPSQTRAFLAGFRYIAVDESFLYSQVGENPAATQGLYRVHTTNSLLGVQLGGRIQEVYSTWQWGIDGKVGGLLNFVERNSTVNAISEGVASDRNEALDDEQLGIMVQASLGAAYRIRPGLSFHTSYNMLFLSNLALVHENLSLAPTFPIIDIDGTAIYHGLSTGVEWTW